MPQNYLNRNSPNSLIGQAEDYGTLPIKNQYGQYQVGGDLGGREGVLDKAYEVLPFVGDVRAMDRAQEAARPTITPNLMGGADVGIEDPYTAAFETATAMPAVGDVATLFKMGAMSLPGIIALMARKTDDVVSLARGPLRSQAGTIGSKPMAVPMDKRLIGERRVNRMFDEMAANNRRVTPERRQMAVRNPAQSADLPMDEASRMARAQEMGFDTDNVYYHGTGNDIEKFNSDLGGVYFTDDPSYADRYTTRNGESGRNIIPVYLKKEAVFDTRKPAHRKIYEEKFLNKYGNGTPIKEDGLPDWVESHDFQEFFKEENLPFDAAIVGEPPDLMPDGTYKNKSSLLITKGENIRSKFAKFDPAKKNSANILAGTGAAAIGANALLSDRDEYVTR